MIAELSRLRLVEGRERASVDALLYRALAGFCPRSSVPLVLSAFALAGCQEDVGAGRDAVATSNPCGVLEGRTISWIVPYAPGGGFDVLSRILEPFLEEAVGAQIVVSNRPGGGGIVGARVLHDAEPDGLTLGIINGSALLVRALIEDDGGLEPQDFTVLGRIIASKPVWLTGTDSPFRRVEDIIARNRDAPAVFGISDIGSEGFLSASVGSDLLGIEIEYLSGYDGSRQNTLGLIRGDADLVALHFESVRDLVEAGDIRPVLQVTRGNGYDPPPLRGVPSLGGVDGWAAKRALELGRDPTEAVTRAAALSRLFDAGRIVAAPPGLDSSRTECLQVSLAEVVHAPAFIETFRRTGWTLSYLDADEAMEALDFSTEAQRLLAPELEAHAARVRTGR